MRERSSKTRQPRRTYVISISHPFHCATVLLDSARSHAARASSPFTTSPTTHQLRTYVVDRSPSWRLVSLLSCTPAHFNTHVRPMRLSRESRVSWGSRLIAVTVRTRAIIQEATRTLLTPFMHQPKQLNLMWSLLRILRAVALFQVLHVLGHNSRFWFQM